MSVKIKKEPEFSFVFPVHNEEKIIVKQIKKLIDFLETQNIKNYEVFLINNGSQDKTSQKILYLQKKYKKIKKLELSFPSYGLAIKHALLSTNARYIFLQDVDFFDTNFIKYAIKNRKKYKIIVGSKNLIKENDQRSLLEKTRTRFLSFLLDKFFGYPGTDSHGIKMIRNSKNLKKTILLCNTQYELFDTELMVKLLRKTKNFKEIPVKTINIRPSRYTKFRRFKLTAYDLLRRSRSKIIKRNFINIQNVKVNADDYGLNRNVNKAIEFQYKTKSVDSFSVISNLLSKKDKKHLKNIIKKENIVLHFNLLRKKPISNVKTLTKNKNFHILPSFFIKLILKKINLQEIEIELEKQYSNLIKEKISISKIDSEQHLHTLYPIWIIVNEFAVKNNLKVRSIESTAQSLSKKPIKFFTWKAMMFLSRIFYKKENYKKAKTYHCLICHPGNNFN